MNNNNSTPIRTSSGNGGSGPWTSPLSSPVSPGRPPSLLDHQQGLPNVVGVVVTRDGGGYGMKVSGDNPVYVQSVKEGGPAEKAGLHSGDKIIQVNGTNVMHSTHTDVVALIKSSAQVVLTVQQRTSPLRSPGSRSNTVPASSRVTGPQPVDHEKQYQLQKDKEQYYRLMIEKEQHHLDKLRSQIATSSNEKKCSELAKAEKNLRILQDTLQRTLSEQHSPEAGPAPRPHSSPAWGGGPDRPPPLPKRNKPPHDVNALFLSNEINANCRKKTAGGGGDDVVDDLNAFGDTPPPLPPRTYPPYNNNNVDDAPSAVNSIDKQMSYPLVATCTSLHSDGSPSSPKHHRTKSSPESLMVLGGGDNNKSWQQRPATPPGTPPPPYPSPQLGRRSGDRVLLGDLDFGSPDSSFEDHSHGNGSKLLNSSPIRAANSRVAQQTIISMEDDDMSDLEMEQCEDHGHFKSLYKLWEHLPHLAVFMNYVLSNSDPNSLLFYLLTDLYKEGNAKEMRKWAFEIHSCFLVPGAPLRLSNVDENVAREIDDYLNREYDKEDIMRRIFWKARNRAKEEIGRQLTDFQQKITAGLGTMYGPTDQELRDHYNDKAKEAKLYEQLFLPKLEMYLEEFEKDNYDAAKYLIASALVTVLTRVFRVRPPNLDLDRVPAFVNKERSFKSKVFGRYSRKLNHLSHQFVSQQYFSVTSCNYCHQIIYGLSPQGYQCTSCLINLHRPCVKLFDDSCPGPFKGKDRGIRKLIGGMRHDAAAEQHRLRKTSHFIQMEKEKRQMEERENRTESLENAEAKVSQPVSRTGSDRRPDAVREDVQKDDAQAQDARDVALDSHEKSESPSFQESSSGSQNGGAKRRTGSHINRSESVKEQSEKNRKQQRRNISDPSHTHNNSSCEVDFERQQQHQGLPGLGKSTESGSSSNSSISCNGRLSESPSNSMDVHQATVRTQSDSDSDMDGGEMEPLNWQELVTQEELNKLNPNEKKRQEVINELFLTEESHVRMLKVLYKLFYKSLRTSQALKQEEMNLLFPNIKELLNAHLEIDKEMKRMRKEDPLVRQIGDVLLATFTGTQGEQLQREAAAFCERQQLALEFIKKRRERDNKFDALLGECEKKRQCRRLQLQGIVPAEMQRLTRYPLLLERLIKSVEAAGEEYEEELSKLKQAHHHSKEILGRVNDAAKLALNKHRLEEIQRHLDVSNFQGSNHPIVGDFKNIDLTRYKLILEGSLLLRRPNKAAVPVHILLLEELVVLLQRESEKYILKFFQSGSPSQQTPLSPIIKMSTLLVRKNAVQKNALFLVNTSATSSQMYDLQAEDEAKRETWRKHFSDAAEAYNRREGKVSRTGPLVGATPLHTNSISDSDTESIRELPVETEEEEEEEAAAATENEETSLAKTAPPQDEGGDRSSPQEEDGGRTPVLDVTGEGDGIRLTTKVSAEEWPLIQPSQVNVIEPPVYTAEQMLTPLEQLRRKDALVKQTLSEKEDLLADMLAIPREHFEHIADMASTKAADSSLPGSTAPSDITDRLLACVFQVDVLQKAVNESLNVTEGDVLAARGGGKFPVCASQEPHYSNEPPPRSVIPPAAVPAALVRDVAASLSLQLTTLMSEIKQVEEERDKLRKELHKVTEKLHEEHHLHSPVPFEDNVASDDSTQEVFCEASSIEPK